MEYNFSEVERKWQASWRERKVYQVEEDDSKEKFYVLDMFPYPSGAGLHVGHPLGYIASDIFARYKRHCGFNVLHPMGYDSFGLPAEQYAIQTGQHPAITTQKNVARYREQLDRIGFSFDWSREVRTSDPEYYRWTQWIFKLLYNAWYDQKEKKAKPIDDLVSVFENEGNGSVLAAHACETSFSADEWKAFSKKQKEEILLSYRLAYLSESVVNWCPALGTVLANDEVKDGLSERGGHPVEQRKMTQWSMRITAYAERLLQGLENLDWSDALKEVQKNWIGKSKGASVQFDVDGHDEQIEVFTTRPDTIFGVSFMVIAPEHPLVDVITTEEQKTVIADYVEQTKKRSERDRMADVKTVSGAFTGAHVKHPFTGKLIPVWIGDYVLINYGTGAVMAVPSGDQRDWNFAKHFGIDIPNVIEGADISEGAAEDKGAKLVNSEFLNGMKSKDAISLIIKKLEEKGAGRGTTSYKLRDAVFGRQRYWGEPIPVYYDENGMPALVKDEHLPLQLPEVDKYLPTEDGEPPLARGQKWSYDPEKGIVEDGEGYKLETTTMPGWAGSSWYYLRYADPKNSNAFVDREKSDYWGSVDLYLGGAEHATGHLLYVRFWTKVLFDLGYIGFDEPAKKLINQGMIQGDSRFVYRIDGTNTFVSAGLRKEHKTTRLHVDVNIVDGDVLDTEAFKKWLPEYSNAEFILEDGKYKCGSEVEKMSKSKYNVVNPDLLIEKYGADALRLHEMFLGPIEVHKPWNTKGIDGVGKFLRRLYRLYVDGDGQLQVNDEAPNKDELKALHKAIKRVREDLERYSFNTPVSHFMIAVNELTELGCSKRAILEPLAILIAPFAPHMAEELWSKLGHEGSVVLEEYPSHDESHLVESTFAYPVSFNGKMRFKFELPLGLDKAEIEKAVLESAQAAKWIEGKNIRKVIVVPGKIVNVVV